MGNGYKEVYEPGNGRIVLAKEIVNIYNRLGFGPENSLLRSWWNWADTYDLDSYTERCEGSSPSERTKI